MAETENPADRALDRARSVTPPEDLEWIDRVVARMFDPTVGDLLIEFRRIADALESIAGNKKKCYGETEGAACALPPDHVGHHVSADGRLHWLDKE